MRTAIYGAGSLGTVLGAYIARAGGQAQLVSRNAAHIAALRAHGAQVVGQAAFTKPVEACLPEEMRGKYDCIILMTKQQENEAVANFLLPHLKEDGVCCTAQNGLPEAGLMRVLGKHRVVGCTVGWGATLLSPGVAELTSAPDAMRMTVGSTVPGNTMALAKACAVLQLMCPVQVEPAFLGARWAKLLINATFSGVATVLGCTFGQVAGDARARKAATGVLLECLAAAGAAGVIMGPVQGIAVARLLKRPTPFKCSIVRGIMPIAMRKHRDIKPSMLQDIEKGKPTEIAFINGAVSEAGRDTGVRTPYNDAIVEIVRQIEAGACAPGFHQLPVLEKMAAGA